ncbi:hypothetical protein OPW39_15810 [Vibrio europaeus]|uniref:hypothetical protein n=1 Tax=Vibrio europaeus TaxID=300876 RepID=UPI00233ED0E3|nr:hypothetical protein [Vibrio europaeus]MDC5870274.1 hypothetical protein [Vibrio europaeus]
MIDTVTGVAVLTLDKKDKIAFDNDDYIAVFTHGEKQVVYKTKAEYLCLAELMMGEKIIEDTKFMMIYQLSKDHYYCAVVKGSLVTDQFIGNMSGIKSRFEYWLATDMQLYTNSELNLSSNALILDSIDFNDEAYVKYKTTNALGQARLKRKKLTKTLLGLALLLFVALFVGKNLTDKPVTQQVVIDPFQEYKADVSAQMLASVALRETVKLQAFGATFPKKMKVVTVDKNGGNLEVTFKKEDLSQAIFNQWLSSNKQFEHLLQGDRFVLPIDFAGNRWVGEIANVDGYFEHLQVYVLGLGANNVKITEWTDSNNYSQQTLTFNLANKEIGVLSLLSDELKDAPVFLTSLTMKPSEVAVGQIQTATITLVVKGNKK